MISAERRRQVEAEGFDTEHDDAHIDRELMAAGLAYLHFDEFRALRADGAPHGWPWDGTWWKPKDRESNIVRAGALFLAEVDRLKRLGPIEANTRPAEHKLQLAVEKLADLLQAELL